MLFFLLSIAATMGPCIEGGGGMMICSSSFCQLLQLLPQRDLATREEGRGCAASPPIVNCCHSGTLR